MRVFDLSAGTRPAASTEPVEVSPFSDRDWAAVGGDGRRRILAHPPAPGWTGAGSRTVGRPRGTVGRTAGEEAGVAQ